jgi:hypothetical protein
MTMGPRLRRLVLTVHVTSSVAGLGAVATFLLLAIAGATSARPELVRAAYPAMLLIAWAAILPLLAMSLLIGTVQALATPWGLFRHYWVLAKLLLNAVALLVLLLQMNVLGALADAADAGALGQPGWALVRFSPVLHAAGGLIVLLLAVVLSIYKPKGLTRHGWRTRRAGSIAPG